MLAVLLLFSCLHQSWADANGKMVGNNIAIQSNRKEVKGTYALVAYIPKDTNYIMKQNVSCPALGFYLKREAEPNAVEPGNCYLCFCQNNGTAVCWRRENKRCDLDHYHDFGKSISRLRRSPLSFGEVFVRDAAREFFNKQSPEQCKPYESSFSDGCPPVDWCIGCTVCDCDANGRWDCHVLSFCPDKNGKKQMKKRRGYPKSHMAKRQSKTSTKNVARNAKITPKPSKKPIRQHSVKPAIKKNQVKQSSQNNRRRIDPIKGKKVNKFASVKKPLPKAQARKAIPSRNNVTKKPPLVKKQGSMGKNLNIKSNKDKNYKNNTVEVAQKVVKQFMTTMQKMIKNIDRQTNSTSKQANKVIKKRSMNKKENKRNVERVQKNPKFEAKSTQNSNIYKKVVGKKNTLKPQNSIPRKSGRMKRQVAVTDNSLQTINSNYSSKDTASNIRKEYMETNTTHNLLENPIKAVLNTSYTFNNTSTKLLQLTSSMSPEVYITEQHIYKENHDNIVRNGQQYEKLNNTKSTALWTFDNAGLLQNSSNITLSTTDSAYLSTSSLHLYTNITNLTQELHGNEKNYGNIFKFTQNLSNFSTQIEHNNCKFKTLLHKLIGSNTDRNNQSHTNYESSKKPRRYTVLNKIRRLFKKIFSKNNIKKFQHKDSLYYNDFDIKKSSNCKLDLKEKKKLRQRMNELKIESDDILSTVRIIKGLLHLLEMNTNETQNKTLSTPDNLKESINKLNAIIKNNYIKGDNSKSITEDQRTQVNYIRNNVQVFIKSVGRFARILDDVIKIAMYHIKRQTKMNWIEVEKNKNHTSTDLILYNTTKNKLDKLKKMIFNYNILQNKFINDIYLILKNLEVTITDTKTLQHMHGTNHTNINKTDAIETNSENIIKNIRKLRILADRMNAQRRRKREVVDDDDALEYLLILMEYLLKRHAPIYPPVNDGIDLLIEAIKSAPDIKLVRKKVLDNVTQKNYVTRTTTPINLFNKDSNDLSSNKERKEKNILVQAKFNKTKIADQLEDDDDDEEDRIEENYRAFKSDKDLILAHKQDDIVLESDSKQAIIDPHYNIKEVTTPIIDIKNKVVLSSTDNLAVELETTSISPVEVNRGHMIADIKDSNKGNSNVENILIDAKANIDWIEENFKEITQPRKVKPVSSTPKSLIATRTHKITKDISDVSNENEIYNLKKADKTSTEEVMSKKQMDLLNSLDYVGDKDIEEDIDSKDDKYLNDIYA